MKSDCDGYKKWLTKKAIGSKENVKLCQEPNDDNWCFLSSIHNDADSGASSHITNNKKIFDSLDESIKETVYVANGEKVNSIGRGNGTLHYLNYQNDEKQMRITDVMYIPEMKGNLLSVKRLAQKGFEVSFSANRCEIKRNNEVIAFGDSVGNLYKLRQRQCVFTISEEKTSCIHVWHKILGHRDINSIRSMNHGGLANGINIRNCHCTGSCEVCVQGKMSRYEFPSKAKQKSTKILDLIHTDVCGPMQTITPSGKKYFLTFIDDHSRFSMVYLLREKSEVYEKLKEYIAYVKTKF